MDFFFPQDDLQRLAPEETHIESIEIVPYPDGERVRVNLHITPFQQRPHLELVLRDMTGTEVSTVSIVEPMSWNLELTMHLRGAGGGRFVLEARLFYPDGPQTDPVTRSFEVVSPQ
ncbi:MAG TPA: hypothetical protein VIU38_11275 [Anaerolineales bacterium]